MREQGDKFKKLTLFRDDKTYNLLDESDIKEFTTVLLDELLKVEESIDNNTNIRYVAITSLHITQYVCSLEELAGYLERNRETAITNEKIQGIVKTINNIKVISENFKTAIFKETIYSAILRAEELEQELNQLLILCK